MTFTIIGYLLTSCGTIPVYNARIYGDLGENGSHYAETLTDKTGDLKKDDWDKLRVGMLCMSSQSFNDLTTAIDQFCTAYNVCDYQSREDLQQVVRRIKRIIKRQRGNK